MKTKVLSPFLYPLLVVLLMSFSDPYTIKRISDANFRYEFYTTDKKIKPKSNKFYYWFKGGAIHNAQAGTAGVLLDDKYVKMYHSNQLAEQGEFKKGLKIGFWKTWHPNGTIQTTQYWDNGLKIGLYYRYDENGVAIEKGNYKSDKKHGLWVDYKKTDTVVYKRGVVFVKKIKLSKAEKALLKTEIKKENEVKQALKESEKTRKAADKANKKDSKKVSENTPEKDSFFKRLFAKKQPKRNTNGQGA